MLVEKRECTSPSAEAKSASREVGEERPQLVGGEHPLVDAGAAGQRREVHVGVLLDALAHHEGHAIEVESRQLSLVGIGAAMNNCQNRGITARAVAPRDSAFDRHIAPAQE